MHIYIGLVHYPVYNKNRQVIASATTTVDIHDIARLAKTYGARKYYVITPLTDQQKLVAKICMHWTEGYGAQYNSHRKEAIELVEIVPSLAKMTEAITDSEGITPLIIATDASTREGRRLSFADAKVIIQEGTPVIVLLGTAWGLEEGIINRADYMLEPVMQTAAYNHLSVRTAAAIILDRLAGRRTGG